VGCLARLEEIAAEGASDERHRSRIVDWRVGVMGHPFCRHATDTEVPGELATAVR
jgi:hypothetical protein